MLTFLERMAIMKTQELKERLIKKIEDANEAQLLQLEIFLGSFEKEGDWYKNASPALKDALKKSLSQIERGELIPQEEVLKETREKYGIHKNIDNANTPQEIKDLIKTAQKQAKNGLTQSNDEVKKLINKKYGFQL